MDITSVEHGATVSISGTNEPRSDATAGSVESLAIGAAIEECPLQTAVAHLARAALKQHVLYLEGECVPRADLARAIDIWSTLYGRIQASVCPITRHSTPDASGPAGIRGDPPWDVPEDVRGQLLRALAVCAARDVVEGCPLARLPEPRLLDVAPHAEA